MSPRIFELLRPRFRWLVPGVLAALAPKCVLCLAAYGGIGTVLGWNGVEICGGQDGDLTHRVTWLVLTAAALIALVFRACGGFARHLRPEKARSGCRSGDGSRNLERRTRKVQVCP